MPGTAVLSGREVLWSPDAVPYGPRREESSEERSRIWQVGAVNQSVVVSRMYSGQMGADRGMKASQEHSSSALRRLMSFRWEVNRNREQRTPERAVQRSAVQPSSRPRENRQPSQLCSPSVQPTIAVSTVQAFRSWSSSGISIELARAHYFVSRLFCREVSVTILFHTVRIGASTCISKSAA